MFGQFSVFRFGSDGFAVFASYVFNQTTDQIKYNYEKLQFQTKSPSIVGDQLCVTAFKQMFFHICFETVSCIKPRKHLHMLSSDLTQPKQMFVIKTVQLKNYNIHRDNLFTKLY